MPKKLTDAQLVLLSAAAQHPQGAIELASNLKGAAAKKAVGKLLREGLIEEVSSLGTLPVWRRDERQEALALQISPSGLAAIGIETNIDGREVEAAADTQGGDDPSLKRPPRRVAAAKHKTSKDEAPRRSGTQSPRNSKQSHVIEMLQRREGTTIAAIMKATGWQQHSVRGFFAAVVHKKLGLNLLSEKTGTGRVYRIVVKTPSRKSKSRRKAA